MRLWYGERQPPPAPIGSGAATNLGQTLLGLGDAGRVGLVLPGQAVDFDGLAAVQIHAVV